MRGNKALLKIKNLSKKYDSLRVIDNFELNINNEGIYCLFGPSGCGKTTLLNLLSGLTSRDEGMIEGLENKRISYIFQEDRLLPWLTVEENVAFVLQGHKNSVAQEGVDKYLKLVGLEGFRRAYPHELSGGMKQRVSIARAFAHEGDILLMDEPFKGLHLDMKIQLMDYIIDYWYMKKGIFILVTHELEEAIYLSNEIYLLEGPPLKIKGQATINKELKKRSYDNVDFMRDRERVLRLINGNVNKD